MTRVVFLRWRYSRVRRYLGVELQAVQLRTLGVPVEVLSPFGIDRVGALKRGPARPLADESAWLDVATECAEVFAGKRDRLGVLLYGPPGNGKTSLVKYLALKHGVPIKLVTLSPNYTNHDIMLVFARIPARCIVLFEDFDNSFHGRTCVIGSGNTHIQFSFDAILNGLDGVYGSHEGVVFVMTANDVTRVDPAVRDRPSRVKYVREFANPSASLRESLLPGWADATAGLNLDQLLRVAEFREAGHSLSVALAKLDRQPAPEAVERLAHTRYLARLAAGETGTPEGDWAWAVERLKSSETKGSETAPLVALAPLIEPNARPPVV